MYYIVVKISKKTLRTPASRPKPVVDVSAKVTSRICTDTPFISTVVDEIMAREIEVQTLKQIGQTDGKREMSMMDRCVDFLERDTRGIQIITYGITSVGLLTALYRIRPFAKFTKPSDVPSRFIRLRIPLQGTVARIEPSHGALLMVDHKPLVDLPRLGTNKFLPVKIAGVDVTNHGISWLQTVVNGKEIEFIPVGKKNDYLDCTINLQETKETRVSIGEELVRLGFGTVGDLEPVPSNDQQILAYKASLNAAQKRAKLERNGQWHFTINPTYLWRLRNFLHTKISHALPTKMSRQFST